MLQPEMLDRGEKEDPCLPPLGNKTGALVFNHKRGREDPDAEAWSKQLILAGPCLHPKRLLMWSLTERQKRRQGNSRSRSSGVDSGSHEGGPGASGHSPGSLENKGLEDRWGLGQQRHSMLAWSPGPSTQQLPKHRKKGCDRITFFPKNKDYSGAGVENGLKG